MALVFCRYCSMTFAFVGAMPSERSDVGMLTHRERMPPLVSSVINHYVFDNKVRLSTTEAVIEQLLAALRIGARHAVATIRPFAAPACIPLASLVQNRLLAQLGLSANSTHLHNSGN